MKLIRKWPWPTVILYSAYCSTVIIMLLSWMFCIVYVCTHGQQNSMALVNAFNVVAIYIVLSNTVFNAHHKPVT